MEWMKFGTLMFEEVNLIYGKDDFKDKYSDNKDILANANVNVK